MGSFYRIIVFLILSSISGSLLAHHSHGNYQVQSLIEIQGVVTDFHLANPHVWIFLDVEDESGEVANWAVEGGSPASFVRGGQSDIAPGDNLTLTCAPTRAGDNGCLVKNIQVNSSGGEQITAPSWTNMVFQDDFFQINFPHEPDVRRDSYESEYGASLPSTIYEARDGDGRYSVTVVDFGRIKEIHDAQAEQVTVAGAHNFWFFDQLAAISYVARQFRLQSTEVHYDAWHVIDGIEGHQITVLNPDNTRSHVGIYRHADRLYILEAKVPAEAPPQGIFQQSLNIIDEEGARIRYRLLPDHSTERVEVE
jgi:hypothetical protein